MDSCPFTRLFMVQEQTERMVQQYVDGTGAAGSDNRSPAVHDIAAALSEVAQLVHSVRGRLDLMQQQSATGLEGLVSSCPQVPEAQRNVLSQQPMTQHVAGGASTDRTGVLAVGSAAEVAEAVSSTFNVFGEPSGRFHGATEAVRMINRVVHARFLAKRWAGDRGSHANPEQES
jgi:hypothetical protein